MLSRNLTALICILLLAACAVGNTYNYDANTMNLPVQGSGEVGLVIVDQRPYVLSGDKPSSFVGLQRGGFGNPFNVKTASGKPLSEEMQESLSRSLETYGFVVHELAQPGNNMNEIQNSVSDKKLPRNLVITLNEWKTDAMANFGLSYNVDLQILDGRGELLARNRIQGDKEKLGGAGFESANSISASRAFESKMNQLFNDPEIRRVMQGGN